MDNIDCMIAELALLQGKEKDLVSFISTPPFHELDKTSRELIVRKRGIICEHIIVLRTLIEHTINQENLKGN
ncbi:hypothetical protein UGMREWDR_CDS0189 [Aeromonas phage GomatiRiver_11]|nr:hypothetical protein OBDJBBDK_00178 [Aeromonas phage AhFM11]WKW84356.1 hypothetical protein UGMREWDR_CDS0189 [Aeromonas phage GomatiRiver_11]